MPFANLQAEVDSTLASLATKVLNPASSPPYHKYLAAFRLKHDNFRGAATALYAHLTRLKGSSAINSAGKIKFNNNNYNYNKTRHHKDGEIHNERLLNAYLALINVLASVNPDEAWILDEAPSSSSDTLDALSGRRVSDGLEQQQNKQQHLRQRQHQQQRQLVTLADIRREYQYELDRMAVLQTGQFPIVEDDGGDDEMDIL